MDIYLLTLFLHLAGVAWLFVSLGLEWAGTRLLREAETMADFRRWGAVAAPLRWSGIAGGAVVLLTGLGMASIRWSWDSGWILAAIFAVLLMFALGAGLTGTRFAAFGRGVAEGRIPITSALQEIRSDPAVRISFHTRAVLLVAVLFLMTNKPGPVGALVVLVLALAIGVGSVLVAPTREPSPTA